MRCPPSGVRKYEGSIRRPGRTAGDNSGETTEEIEDGEYAAGNQRAALRRAPVRREQQR